MSTGVALPTVADGAQAGEPSAALCKFWSNGKCTKGDSCRFRHAFLDDVEEKHIRELQRHRETLRQREHDPLDPFEDKLPRSTRALVFAEWLVRTFGTERLREGSGVVDVAGGKGHLAFQLQCTEHDVPTTLIEPRYAKLHRKQIKLLKKQRKPVFRQLCALFEPTLWTPPDPSSLPLSSSSPPNKRRLVSVDEGQEGSSTMVSPPAFAVELLPSEAAYEILRDCSVVVGLHPDQATEPIVDFALEHNKGFAVVPCCVFPSCFPDRRLADGSRVVVFDEFIRYLQEKDPRIRVAYLEMAGRNKVLYMRPEEDRPPCVPESKKS